MVRNGKLARLPYAIRAAVNEQLRDGKPGVEIIAWLNRMTSVQEVLQEYFEGRPINDQNLTEWKAGGYQEWLRHLETRESVQEWVGETEDLESQAGEYRSVADCLSAPLALELRRCLQETALDTSLTPKERRDAIIALVHASTQLRRANQSGIKLAAEQDRKDQQLEASREKALEEKRKEQQRTEAFQVMVRQMEAEKAQRQEMEAQMRQEAEARRRNSRRPAPAQPSEPHPKQTLDFSKLAPSPGSANPPGVAETGGSSENEAPAAPSNTHGDFRVIQANSNQFKPENLAGQTGVPVIEPRPPKPQHPSDTASTSLEQFK